jgi:cytochrome c-type biogenesis protein CcmH/NrfG
MKTVKILFLLSVFLFSGLYAKSFPVCKEFYYINENKTGEKSTFLEKILKENPENVECMLKLASLYLRTNRVSQAFDLIRRAYTIDPEFVERQNISKILDLALRLSRLGELAHKNKDPELYNELGDTYYEVGIFDEAAHAYEKSIALDEKQPRIKTLLALSYANLGQYIKSEKVLRRLVEAEPYNFYANYYLGKVLKNGLDQPKEGNIYLRMASYILNHTDIKLEKEGEKEFLRKDLQDELKGNE